MYVLALTVGYILTYPILTYFFQYFFTGKITKPQFSLWHMWGIFVFLTGVLAVVLMIPDAELANRVQHAIGGGFVMVMLSYIALLAARIRITRFQFFCISLMIASCFGIINELLESIMQLGLSSEHIFAETIEDTWYDLWANSLGALLASIIFTFFLWRKI